MLTGIKNNAHFAVSGLPRFREESVSPGTALYDVTVVHLHRLHHSMQGILLMKEGRMYRKILVAYNGTPESRLALNECIRLSPGPSAEVHLLAVITLTPFLLAGEFAAPVPSIDEEEAERHAMENILESGRALLAEAGLKVITHLEVGEPANVITDLVRKAEIELVIVGHSRHKPFAMRWWRGSMDALLVEKVRCSVLVAADPEHATTS